MANTARSYFSSWELTNELKVNIDELIFTLSPDELPFLTGLGSDGNILLPRVPVDQISFTWQEAEVPLPRTTLNEDLDGSETGIDVATGTGIFFAVGDAIRIDDEVMLITAVTGDTLTVTRGSAAGTGTAAATHTTGAEVVGIGSLLQEGEIASGVYQDRDKYSNYTQIFSRTVEATRTAQQVTKYGVPNELSEQSAANMKGLLLGLEQAIIYGTKFKKSDSTLRSMGGLTSFITTNVNSTDTWLTVESIEDMQQLAFDQGGSFNTIAARPRSFLALNNTAGNERVQTVTVDDARRGRRRAQVVMTEFGDVDLVRHRWFRKGDAVAVNRENVILRVFQPVVVEKLAKTKDRDQYMMVGEYSLEVKGQDHMGKWTGLNPSAPLPSNLV